MDLTGQKFGRLTVLGLAFKKTYNCGQSTNFWRCQCDCGNTKDIDQRQLKNGGTKSCGCYRKEVVSALKRKYTDEDRDIRIRYKGMKQRCYDENADNYKHYGGKGIKICDEWLNDFMSFRDWSIDNGYSKELTLDRIDVNGDYSPENCRWVSWKDQQNNKSSNHMVDCFGEQLTMSETSEKYNIPYSKLRARLQRGWSDEDAISK